MGHRLQHFRTPQVCNGVEFAPAVYCEPFSLRPIMIGLSPHRNSWGMFCCLLLIFSCLSPGYAQDSGRKVLKKVAPQYPSILKSKGIGGTVRLKVFIKPDGSVKDSNVVGGNPILAESAQKAVAQWKFSPGGAETTMEVSVVFDPHSESEN